MKKTLTIIMALCLFFCLSACTQSLESMEESTDATLEETNDVSDAEVGEQNVDADETDAAQDSEAGETSADANEADDMAEPAEETVVMTESYEQGRQSYYDATGIMLPEIADATMADSSCFDEEYACFDITGTYDLYTEIVAFFTDYFGSAPEPGTSGGMEKSSWEFENTDGGTDCYEVYWNSKGMIYINYWAN